MRPISKIFCTSLFTVTALFAQGPGPDFAGPGGPGGPGGFGPGGGPHEPLVTGAPYSALKTETHQETLTDGNQIQQTRTAKLYRDAAGRTRTESTMTTPSGKTRTMITISDPAAGFVAHLNPSDSTAVKMTVKVRPNADSDHKRHKESADANGPQVVKTDLGASTISGLAATGTRITMTLPAGAMGNAGPIVHTREIWTSTELKIPLKITSSDPQHGTSTTILSDISQASPDETLFQIPSGYSVKMAPLTVAVAAPADLGEKI